MKNNFNKTQNKPFQVSNELIDWLNCQTALTEKLQQLTGDARVDVLAMDWDEHNEWEAKQLGIVEGKLLRREVLILSRQMPCWYARTFVPESCYALAPEFFQRLHHQPLSELIYSQPKVKRESLCYYPLTEYSEEQNWLPKLSQQILEGGLWARLAAFSFQEKEKFFLCEILFEHSLVFSQQGIDD